MATQFSLTPGIVWSSLFSSGKFLFDIGSNLTIQFPTESDILLDSDSTKNGLLVTVSPSWPQLAVQDLFSLSCEYKS